MPALQPVQDNFFDTAPVRLVGSFDVPRPAGEVWAELTGDDALAWCRILKDVRWTSPRPFGVGTTRTVRTVASTSVLDEYFFRWEEGRRKSFYVVRASMPGFRRLAEDYLVEPTSEGSCRFTWTIAYELQPAMRPMAALNRLLLSTLFRDTRRHYGIG